MRLFVSGIAFDEPSLIDTVPLAETVKTVGLRSGFAVVRESVEDEVPSDGIWILLPVLILCVIICIT